MKKLLIFGNAEIAELACFYFRLTGRGVAGFCVDVDFIRENTLLGLPVIPFHEVSKRFPPTDYDMFIAIGYSDVNRLRRDKYLLAKSMGYTLPTCISPHAVVHTSQVGDNCLIMDMNNIHPYTRIGNNVLFSNSNHIGHHATVGDHCFITGNVVVCGRAEVGEGTFLGVHATVRERVKTGKYNVIGIGVDVYTNTDDNAVYSLPHTKPRDMLSCDIKNL